MSLPATGEVPLHSRLFISEFSRTLAFGDSIVPSIPIDSLPKNRVEFFSIFFEEIILIKIDLRKMHHPVTISHILAPVALGIHFELLYKLIAVGLAENIVVSADIVMHTLLPLYKQRSDLCRLRPTEGAPPGLTTWSQNENNSLHSFLHRQIIYFSTVLQRILGSIT